MYGHSLKSIRIKYNPKKFLNFNHLLHSELGESTQQEEHMITRDIQKDLEMQEILYKSIYSTKKEYNVSKTTPTEHDRAIFKDTLARSRSAAFVNRNVLLSYPFDFKRWSKCPPLIRKTRVKAIYINQTEIKTLYPSPYPEHINKEPIIHICENCLSFNSSRFQHYRHQQKCTTYGNPPGSLIYRNGTLRLYEIDGRESPKYCRNLCLLSMLFLKSKTLFYEVDPFIFYVLYNGNQIVGYFSKEKLNSTGYNLSCILTLPMFRRQGFGNLLMEFSYLLSRREFKAGTPEKPLSDLGLLTYRYYWKSKVAEVLLHLRETAGDGRTAINVSLEELSNLTGMTTSDVVFGLEQLEALYSNNEGSKYSIIISDWSLIESVRNKWRQKMLWRIQPELLIWKPLIFGPSCGINSVNNNNLDIANENARANGSPTLDAFNQQVQAMGAFMTDDIADTRDTEIASMAKIKARVATTTVEVPPGPWKLCFEQPLGAHVKHKQSLRSSASPAAIYTEASESQEPANPGDETLTNPGETEQGVTVAPLDTGDADYSGDDSGSSEI